MPAEKINDADRGGGVTSVQMQMKRAEVMGMPVHLFKKENRNSATPPPRGILFYFCYYKRMSLYNLIYLMLYYLNIYSQ